MDGATYGSSWRPFYIVPFVLWTREPTGLRRAPPPHETERCLPSHVRSAEVDKDETYTDIENNLIRLLDEEDGAVVVPRRFKVRNQKLPRRALVWNRFVFKLLLLFLLRNDHIGHFCSGAIGA